MNGIRSSSGKFLIRLRLAFGVALTLLVQSAMAITLPEAVDATNLVWTAGGAIPWGVTTATTHDGVDAAQSGAIGDSQSSYVETKIVGPGRLSFWWKVSSEDYFIPNTWYDYLGVSINGGLAARIAGEISWQQRSFPLPTGTNTIRWTYSKDGSDPFIFPWSDRAWLDQVAFLPDVTTTNDGGPFSLRQVIADASSASTIRFASSLSGQTIVLTNGEILLDKNLTIDASALPAGIRIDGNANGRIFQVSAGANVLLDSLTITNGFVVGNGGGIANDGTLTVNRCTLAGNRATNNVPAANFGGGIFNNGTLTVNESSFVGNAVSYFGGGLMNYYAGTCTVNQSTFWGNTANIADGAIGSYANLTLSQSTVTSNSAPYGAGVFHNAPMTLHNSIVAGNAPDNLYSSLATVTNTGANLTNGVPLLAPLDNYGGITPTMPPLPGSPAIDAATSTTFSTDQRGGPRIVGPTPDIGAVEAGVNPIITSLADAGLGSLRYATTYGSNGAAFTFDAALSGQAIVLTNGQLLLTNNVTIDASTLPTGIALNGNHASRIFQVAVGVNAVLDSLTLTNGKAADGVSGATGADGGGSNPGGPGGTGGPGASGGGIYNDGTLTLNRVTMSGNSAGNGGNGGNGGPGIIQGGGGIGGRGGDGGAIYNAGGGTLILLNSTLDNNKAGFGANGGSGASQGDGGNGGSGGGIANAGILRLTHTTVTDNAAGTRGNTGSVTPSQGNGGGIHTSGTLTLTNTLVALNTAPGVGPDLSGSASTIGGVNFIGNASGASGLGTSGVDYLTGDPLLAELGNFGGPTRTRPALPGSPVIDAASSGLATDQRGATRPQGVNFDIGAVEGAFNSDFTLFSPTLASGGYFQFGFSNVTGMQFTVLTSTNVTLPPYLWTVSGTTVEVPAGSGHYAFTTPAVANEPQRFYCISLYPPIVKWASSVIGFSSQYDVNAWSAAQALGQPDTYPSYADIQTAWATEFQDAPGEFIELGYANPKPTAAVYIYETYNPGAISKVSVRNANTSTWVEVWSGPAAPAPTVARIFTVTFPKTSFPVDGVRIDLDSPAVPDWNEIDAVAIGAD